MVVSLAAYVAEAVPDRDRLLTSLRGGRPLVDQGEHVGVPVVELGQLAVVVPREPQCALVLRDGLAVRTQLGRTACRDGRVPADQVGLAGRLRVERHPGVVVAVLVDQRLQQRRCPAPFR